MYKILKIHAFCKLLTFQLLLLIPLASCANGTTLDKVLTAKERPEGVVIEIVTGDTHGLDWALPQAQSYIRQLRQRFPDIHITIVTHGREQFALQKKQQGKQTKIHSLTKSLQKEDIQLHVCGTYAGWEGLSADDFPEYVDVAPTGPAQVNDYRALGYKLIMIKRRDPD